MDTTASTRVRQELDRCADTPNITNDDVVALDAELASILGRMAARPTYDEANAELNELAELHGLLAMLLFKHRIDLSERQRRVVRKYDRWDDEDTRKDVYWEVVADRL